MFAPRPCNMRGPRLKTLLFLFLLLTALTQTALCQDEDGIEPELTETEEETGDLEAAVDENAVTLEPELTDPSATSAPTQLVPEDTEEDNGSGYNPSSPENGETTLDPGNLDPTSSPDVDEGLGPIIILIPVVLVVVIIGMIVCGILINRRWNNKARDQELRKEDPYLDGSSTEKVPMPMFEEDVPSVLELEMEELDQWMKKDGANAEESKQA